MSRYIIAMGVSGSGKSTFGAALALARGVPYAEGDEFHTEASRQKMAAGIPLTDEDRWPWLESLVEWMGQQPDGAVVACSALRRGYRDVLRRAGEVTFVLLELDHDALLARMTARVGHYMPPSLLTSQLATLEPLQPDEPGIVLPAGLPVADLVQQAQEQLAGRTAE